ncbi:helix-turn-helix transcriptional regulator [Actinokineospora iranica]|uniref:Regulatory protein, luxR family n=1 Tax=Actinokineospora iranica TaxID=1271860 RepID=A0A1G6XPS3_9PSEU|nr:helix-turn-helix transcriptional regulator [Actinokineospora iranica]SDD80219.1 regulatory protein, luxR family [Actinokineospora iranica]
MAARDRRPVARSATRTPSVHNGLIGGRSCPGGGSAPDPGKWGVAALLADAAHEVLVMSTRATAAGGPIEVIRGVDRRTPRRGVRYRLLVPDAARAASGLARLRGAHPLAGADTRTVRHVPTDAIVVDGRVVVLPSAPGEVAAFRLPGVVTTAVELFERVWRTAVPLSTIDPPALDLPAIDLPAAELTVRQRELLTLLTFGATDESAAASLGVSVRTIRRMVADIMHRLGARSRFQAGARAADRGWLLTEAG